MDELLKQMLGTQIEALTSKLQAEAGFEEAQARSFIDALIEKVAALIGSGSLDMASIMGEVDLPDLIQKLEPSELGAKADLTAERATAALESALPDLLDTAKSLLGGLS
ncbi:MAG: hypothetical protein ACI8QC_000236 [Planctomycetota bacterium]|jgi:hypothetical protein